jgi:hypothetical protein
MLGVSEEDRSRQSEEQTGKHYRMCKPPGVRELHGLAHPQQLIEEEKEHRKLGDYGYASIRYWCEQALASRMASNDKSTWVDVIIFDFEQKRPVPNIVVKEVNFKDQLYVRAGHRNVSL